MIPGVTPAQAAANFQHNVANMGGMTPAQKTLMQRYAPQYPPPLSPVPPSAYVNIGVK